MRSHPVVKRSTPDSDIRSPSLEGQSKAGQAVSEQEIADRLQHDSKVTDSFESVGSLGAADSNRSQPTFSSNANTSRHFPAQQDIDSSRILSPLLWEARFTKYIKGLENHKYDVSQDQGSMAFKDDLEIEPAFSPSDFIVEYTSITAQDVSTPDLVCESTCGHIHQAKDQSPHRSIAPAHINVSSNSQISHRTDRSSSFSSEKREFAEYHSPLVQNERVSGADLVNDNHYPSDTLLDNCNPQSKFQQVLSRRFPVQGKRHRNNTKVPMPDRMKQFSRFSLLLPQKVPQMLRNTIESSEQSNTLRSETIYISDASEEESFTPLKATHALPKDLKPRAKRSDEVPIPTKSKQAVPNLEHENKRRLKRKRTCIVDITSDSDDDSSDIREIDHSNRDKFRAKRSHIRNALKPQTPIVIRGSKGRKWDLQ